MGDGVCHGAQAHEEGRLRKRGFPGSCTHAPAVARARHCRSVASLLCRIRAAPDPLAHPRLNASVWGLGPCVDFCPAHRRPMVSIDEAPGGAEASVWLCSGEDVADCERSEGLTAMVRRAVDELSGRPQFYEGSGGERSPAPPGGRASACGAGGSTELLDVVGAWLRPALYYAARLCCCECSSACRLLWPQSSGRLCQQSGISAIAIAGSVLWRRAEHNVGRMGPCLHFGRTCSCPRGTLGSIRLSRGSNAQRPIERAAAHRARSALCACAARIAPKELLA